MVWKRKHRVASLPIVGAEASTTHVAWGLAWTALFFPFFFRCERSLRGVPNARRTHYSFCVMRLLSLPRVLRVKREAESALESFDELENELKSSLFVGSAQFSLVVWIVSEFWDLSRNLKDHVPAVKCRQLIDLSSGTPWIWFLSFFLPFLGCVPQCARIHVVFAFGTIRPTHLFIHVSLTSPFLLVFSFVLFLYVFFAMVCLPYSVQCCHTRTQHGKTALDYAKECRRADRRAEVVALLEWWERRCDVATWYQGEASVSRLQFPVWLLVPFYALSLPLSFALSGYLRDCPWMKCM